MYDFREERELTRVKFTAIVSLLGFALLLGLIGFLVWNATHHPPEFVKPKCENGQIPVYFDIGERTLHMACVPLSDLVKESEETDILT